MKPTQEQVIQWAREAEAYETDDPANANERIWVMNDEELQAATALAYEAGRKDENEACAELCEQPIDEIQITDDCSEYKYRDNQECADAIRTRREQ